MRCPSCQARNPDGAQWCTQCYTSFAAPEPATSSQPTDASPGSAGGEPVAAVETPSRPSDGQLAGATGAGAPEFRVRDGAVEWCCAVCDTWNPLVETSSGGADVCASCMQPMQRSFEASRPEEPAVSENIAVLATAALPGLGHHMLGRTGSGVARGILYVGWLAGALLLLSGAAGTGQSLLPAFVLLVGAIAVWGATMVDVIALARRTGTELLQPRVLLWLVVAVLGVLLVTLATTAVRLPAG